MHKLAALLGDEAVQDAAQNAAQDVDVQGVTTAAASQPVADDGIQLSRQWHPAAMAAKTVIALGQQSVVNGKRIHSNTHTHTRTRNIHTDMPTTKVALTASQGSQGSQASKGRKTRTVI